MDPEPYTDEKPEEELSAMLEREIKTAFRYYTEAPTPASRRREWERFRALIARRSPQQIARMEHARGLRA